MPHIARSQAFKPATTDEFDKNAALAAQEMRERMASDPQFAEAIKLVAEFWLFWYLTAGHKRLGQLIAAVGKGK